MAEQDRLTPTQYRLQKFILRVDVTGTITYTTSVHIYNADDGELDVLNLDISLPPGQINSLMGVINTRLKQLERDTGWTPKPSKELDG